jgi:hypothetical protein
VEEDEHLIRNVREGVDRLEERLRKLTAPSEGALADTARRIYAARRLRDRFFAAGLFADPAWDMLLGLYIAADEGRDMSISSACASAAVPPTTGLRWLLRLEQERLVRRRPSSRDRRRVLVQLTEDAAERLEQALARIASLGG